MQGYEGALFWSMLPLVLRLTFCAMSPPAGIIIPRSCASHRITSLISQLVPQANISRAIFDQIYPTS